MNACRYAINRRKPIVKNRCDIINDSTVRVKKFSVSKWVFFSLVFCLFFVFGMPIDVEVLELVVPLNTDLRPIVGHFALKRQPANQGGCAKSVTVRHLPRAVKVPRTATTPKNIQNLLSAITFPDHCTALGRNVAFESKGEAVKKSPKSLDQTPCLPPTPAVAVHGSDFTAAGKR